VLGRAISMLRKNDRWEINFEKSEGNMWRVRRRMGGHWGEGGEAIVWVMRIYGYSYNVDLLYECNGGDGETELTGGDG
jgi:hypothetical protein